MLDDVFNQLRGLANEVSGNAYTPYSKQPVGTVALLSNGSWIPGVRVENASYPLVIDALISAYSTARCAGRIDLVAVVQNQPFRPSDVLFLSEALDSEWELAAPDVLTRKGISELPNPAKSRDVSLTVDNDSEAAMLALANDVADCAFIPESGFPVGCVVVTEDGSIIPGCNVEHSDWTRGLCAERIAMATARAYGHSSYLRIYLSCPHEPTATPCGACRQVLFELTPDVLIVMARGSASPETTTAEQLLPGGFRGDALRS